MVVFLQQSLRAQGSADHLVRADTSPRGSPHPPREVLHHVWGTGVLWQPLLSSFMATGAIEEDAGGMLLGSDTQHGLRRVPGCCFHGERDLEARRGAARQPGVTPGAPRERSRSEWAAGETAPSRRGGVGRKQRYRWRKTGRRWEWQGPWEAGRREPGESAWWGALKPGGEAQARQVLPQPGEPSSPGWHLLHPPLPCSAKESSSPSKPGQLVEPLLSLSEITLAWSHPGSIRCGEVVPHLTMGAAKTRLGSGDFQSSGLAPWPAAQGGVAQA